MHRREALAVLGVGATAALPGCSLVSEVIDRTQPAEFPDEPPEAAKETVLAFVRAVGRGEYRAACRDRCRLAIEEGQQQLSAEEMSESDLEEWAREARNWYGSAGFSVASTEVVGSEKMDPRAVGAQGYSAGYWIRVRYEGTGNVANPLRKGVIEDDGDWWVLVGTF